MKSFKYALISAIAFAVVSSDAITVSDAKGQIPEMLSEPVKLMDIVPSIYPASDIPEFMSALDSAVTTYLAPFTEKQKIQEDVGYWSVCSTNCIASSAKDELTLMVRSLTAISSDPQMNTRPRFLEFSGYPFQTIFERDEEREVGAVDHLWESRNYILRIRSIDGDVQYVSYVDNIGADSDVKVNWTGCISMGKRYSSIVNALTDMKLVSKDKRQNCAIVLYLVKERTLREITSYEPLVKYDDPSNSKGN